MFQDDLCAEADADERSALSGHLFNCFNKIQLMKSIHCSSGGADAGEDNTFGGEYFLGIAGDFRVQAQCFAGQFYAGQVAGFIVNNCNHDAAYYEQNIQVSSVELFRKTGMVSRLFLIVENIDLRKTSFCWLFIILAQKTLYTLQNKGGAENHVSINSGIKKETAMASSVRGQCPEQAGASKF